MNWYELCLDVLYLAPASVLHLRFTGALSGKRPRGRHVLLYFALLCALQGAARLLGWWDPAAIYLELLELWAVTRFALGVRDAWSGAVLAVYVSQLSFGLVNGLGIALHLWVAGPAFPLAVVSTLASLGISALCYRLILGFLPPEEETPYPGLLLMPCLFFFFGQLYLMETAYCVTFLPVTAADLGEQAFLVGLQALGLGALLCTLYAYRRTCRSFRTQAALDSLTQAVHIQRTYAAQAQLRYERTRAFRHDIRNHLAVLSGLLRDGRHQEAAAYLERLSAASTELSLPYRTGVDAVDVLLAEKLELAAGWETEVSLQLPAGLDPFDLCVIFSNALDNALTACRAVPDRPAIRISGERQGDYCLLRFENTCPDGPMPPEGTGLANIRAAAAQYGGAVSVEKSGGWFRLNVLLSCRPEQKSCRT